MSDPELIWQAYLEHHPRAMLSPERLRLIERRLSEGYALDVLVDAIHGNHLDPHCNGENDRLKQYHGLELILRDADHIERFAELAAASRPVDPLDSAWDSYQTWQRTRGAVWALDQAAGTFPDEIVEEIRKRVEGVPG